ncbi:uncharacterized protein [Panulirus ornatus]|uniref:uncharacterized protein n=1 Tax=Panulirus ornatus TaxID=150431 RepID=UPI003A85720C
MSRVVLAVVVVTAACLPPLSLTHHHALESPPYDHPPAPLRPLPASDGVDSGQPPTPAASEGNSQGSVAMSTPVRQVTQSPSTGREKRGLYDYGTPWERRVYGRRQTQNRRGRWHSRNRSHRYPYGRRRQHHNYRGPDYGDSFHESSHKYNNAGYVDTSGIDSPSRTVSFAQAKASGVLRTSTTTGGHAEGSA